MTKLFGWNGLRGLRFAPALLSSLLFVAATAASAMPEIKTWTTEEGARVLFVAAPEIPILDVRVVFRAGAARDGEMPGIASVTNALLSEGAGDFDAKAFSESVDSTGAQLSSGALRDMGYLGLRTLVEPRYRDKALSLMHLALTAPRFDQAAVERQKQRHMVAIQRNAQQPSRIAERTFYSALFDNHPYGSPPGGTEESVTALTRDDVLSFYKSYYVEKNAVVAIVGAVSESEARAIAKALMANLPSGKRAADLPEVVTPTQSQTERIAYDSLQTHVRMGYPGMRRGDPDYFPLLVGNHVLGGSSLTSKLFDEVREKRGLSYSVYSHFSPMAVPGPFIAALQTGKDQTREAIDVLTATVAEFIAAGPTDKELAAAKKNLIGGFPLRVMSNGDVLEYLAMIGFYDLPLDYLDTFRENVASVSVADVRSAFSRRLKPSDFLTVIVGSSVD